MRFPYIDLHNTYLFEMIGNQFGGAKGNRLFMTGSQSLYSVFVEAVAPRF